MWYVKYYSDQKGMVMNNSVYYNTNIYTKSSRKKYTFKKTLITEKTAGVL